MTAINSTAHITPDELLAMPDNEGYELVDGQLVERNMGTKSSEIAINIAILVGLFARERRLGHVFGSDTSYCCFPENPEKLRRADVSFISFRRLALGETPDGPCTIAPDLAVEVLSPGDLAVEIDEKVQEYLSAGVRLIWVVQPRTRTVRIHRPQDSPLGNVSQLTADKTIDGEDVLPGFSCRVGQFFG